MPFIYLFLGERRKLKELKVVCIKWISNKDLLYSTGNYIQYLGITYNGKSSEKMCIIESLCCIPETNTML